MKKYFIQSIKITLIVFSAFNNISSSILFYNMNKPISEETTDISACGFIEKNHHLHKCAVKDA